MTFNQHWHKRVPNELAAEYIGKGWQVWKREGRTVLLVWPKAGAPE